jgi:CheY-like chemotaxis protein
VAPDPPVRVLHVGDDPEGAEAVVRFLERDDGRFDVRTATSASEGLGRLDEAAFDCVVSDYDLPTRDGVQFLAAVRERRSDLPSSCSPAPEARRTPVMRSPPT